jgi:hypothetical protein
LETPQPGDAEKKRPNKQSGPIEQVVRRSFSRASSTGH